MKPKPPKHAHVEVNNHLITVRRENCMADGAWDGDKSCWLLTYKDRESGEEERNEEESRSMALLWCLNRAGFMKEFGYLFD